MPDESVHSTQKVVLGFILGLILSGICFVIAVVVGMTLGSRHSWVFPLLNAIALILVSLYALSKYNESGMASVGCIEKASAQPHLDPHIELRRLRGV